MEYFTADQHYFHGRIIEYCKRPIKSMKQMHQLMVANHNEIVKEEDTVWHIGDVAMLSSEYAGKLKRIFDKLNGTHHLVLGNHDEFKPFNYINVGFTSVHTAMWFERQGYKFLLAHDPATYVAADDSTILLHGHVHNMWKHLLPDNRIINVGVDVWNFKPISLNKIIELLKEYEIEPK